MSTRCLIIEKQENESYRAIYSHWDGYPSGVGRLLLTNYSDLETLKKLLDQGDISVLREKIGKKHNFDDFTKKGNECSAEKNDWTTFYSRDRGEDCPAYKISCNYELQKLVSDSWCEFLYMFKNGEWLYSPINRLENDDVVFDFIPLTKKIVQK